MTVDHGACGPLGIKARQQKTWASGDFSVVAARIVLVSEQLADAADLRAGWQVLDVACGNGNATLAAARSGAHAVGVDYVPDAARRRARAGAGRRSRRRVPARRRRGPAVADASFDAVLSVFGTMFAPDHQRTADEIVRVTRPGGTVGLASWTPDGFIGQMFRVITRHVPGRRRRSRRCCGAPRSTSSDLFGDAVADARSGGARPAPAGSPPPRSSSPSSAAGTARPSRRSRPSTTAAATRWRPTWPTWPAAGTATATAGASPSRPATSRPSSPSADNSPAAARPHALVPGRRRPASQRGTKPRAPG